MTTIPTLKPTAIAPVTFAQSLREVVQKALAKDLEVAIGITGVSTTSVTAGTIEAILRGGPGNYQAETERMAAPRSASYADLYEAQDELPSEGAPQPPASGLDRHDSAEPSDFMTADPSGGTAENETPAPLRNASGQNGAPNSRPEAAQTAIPPGNATAAASLLQREQGAAVALSHQITRSNRAREKHCRRCGRIKVRLACDCGTR